MTLQYQRKYSTPLTARRKSYGIRERKNSLTKNTELNSRTIIHGKDQIARNMIWKIRSGRHMANLCAIQSKERTNAGSIIILSRNTAETQCMRRGFGRRIGISILRAYRIQI
jgi:hypothetical protein